MISNTIGEEKTTSKKRDDKKISLALMFANVILTIQYLILLYFNILGSRTGANVQLLSKALVGIAFIYALPAVLRRSRIKFIEVFFITVFIFLLHYAIFTENRKYIIDLLFTFLFMCLPAFVYAYSIQDLSILKEAMKKTSFIVFVVGLIIGLLVFSGRLSVGDYSMTLSYYMLMPAIVFLDQLSEKFSINNLILFTMDMMIILSLGSRGPVLCLIVFLFFKLFNPHYKRTYKNTIIRLGLFVIAILVFIFLDNIFEYLYYTFLKYGINSRNLKLFLSKDLHLSGRDAIYEITLAEITNSPILGIGIAGDRRVLGGSYTHNLFIELIANFGIIIGLFFSVIIINLTIKALFIKDKTKYDLLTMWISLGLVPLMVSGSYLTEMKFWIFLGLIYGYRKKSSKFKYNYLEGIQDEKSR